MLSDQIYQAKWCNNSALKPTRKILEQEVKTADAQQATMKVVTRLLKAKKFLNVQRTTSMWGTIGRVSFVRASMSEILSSQSATTVSCQVLKQAHKSAHLSAIAQALAAQGSIQLAHNLCCRHSVVGQWTQATTAPWTERRESKLN